MENIALTYISFAHPMLVASTGYCYFFIPA